MKARKGQNWKSVLEMPFNNILDFLFFSTKLKIKLRIFIWESQTQVKDNFQTEIFKINSFQCKTTLSNN